MENASESQIIQLLTSHKAGKVVANSTKQEFETLSYQQQENPARNQKQTITDLKLYYKTSNANLNIYSAKTLVYITWALKRHRLYEESKSRQGSYELDKQIAQQEGKLGKSPTVFNIPCALMVERKSMNLNISFQILCLTTRIVADDMVTRKDGD